MKRRDPFVIGIAGWKNSGKTTLVTRLVRELARRGFRVATIKHSHHPVRSEAPNTDKDTDTTRHGAAGATAVAILSPAGWGLVGAEPAFMLAPDPDPPLATVVAALGPADIVIVEGMKRAGIPKIETRRTAQALGPPLAETDANVFAIAADHEVQGTGTPAFALDDIAGLTDAVLRRAALDARKEAPR